MILRESPEDLKGKYMDVYEDVYEEVITTNRFDENVDLSTTYLGKIDMKREDIMKAEESFPISEQGYVIGKVLNGEECQILLDTDVSKSYIYQKGIFGGVKHCMICLSLLLKHKGFR